MPLLRDSTFHGAFATDHTMERTSNSHKQKAPNIVGLLCFRLQGPTSSSVPLISLTAFFFAGRLAAFLPRLPPLRFDADFFLAAF